MGGRYCAINSPLGPRWGQKSLDLRSRDFCPHLEPRGELIAQYRPPMSFRYKMQFAMSEFDYTQWTVLECIIIHLKFPTTSSVSIITLWIYELFSALNEPLMTLRKLCDRSLDNNSSVIQNGGKAWLKMQYLVIWYSRENLLHLYKSCLLSLEPGFC